MAVVIRLRNSGTKKKIKRRIVVTDKRSPRDGKFIELIGSWDPLANPNILKLDVDRAKYWISKGAQPSNTVRSLIKKASQAPAS